MRQICLELQVGVSRYLRSNDKFKRFLLAEIHAQDGVVTLRVGGRDLGDVSSDKSGVSLRRSTADRHWSA
jgi:hypothetical protein